MQKTKKIFIVITESVQNISTSLISKIVEKLKIAPSYTAHYVFSESAQPICTAHYLFSESAQPILHIMYFPSRPSPVTGGRKDGDTR